jgi:hypothetical protein
MTGFDNARQARPYGHNDEGRVLRFFVVVHIATVVAMAGVTPPALK